MKILWLCGLCCALGGPAFAADKDDAGVLAQAGKIVAQSGTQMASLKQAATDAASYGARYLQALGKLETQLKERGELQKVLAVRDESERARQAADPLQAKAELPEARQLQRALAAEAGASQHGAAQKIVITAGEALKQLAALRKDVAEKNRGRIKKLADKLTQEASLTWAHEVAPELERPKLAEAPLDKPLTTKAGSGEPYTFYPPGKEPALRNARALRLEIAFADLRTALINYTLTASEAEGLPRISLTAKNRELPAGTRLVIEYFDRYPNPRGFRRESCEHIKLPALARGEGVVVDGHGMREYATKHVAIKTTRPFYGVIISLFDDQGKIFMQGCAPSSLMQECRRELPDPQ